MDRKLRVRAVAAAMGIVLPALSAFALAACAAPVPATETAPAESPRLGDIQTRSRNGMTMVYVPAGQFEMGSSDADLDAAMQACAEALGEREHCQRDKYLAEQPAHVVSLNAF